MSEGQRKWPTIEREAYAIIFAVNKLRHYLRGSQFTVFTDHKPLRSLFTSEMKNARIQRWAIMLQEYGCDIHYHAGKLNVPADFLARIPTTQSARVNVINTDTEEPAPYQRTSKPSAPSTCEDTLENQPTHNSAVQGTQNSNVSQADTTQATSQGDANTTQNDSATLASDDNDTLDLDIARLQRDDPVLSKILKSHKTTQTFQTTLIAS